jgi:hypothetical protein
MNKNIAQDYLNAYKEQIERLKGKDIADRSIFNYDHGWFQIGIAKKYRDGSIGGASFMVSKIRLKTIETMIDVLRSK